MNYIKITTPLTEDKCIDLKSGDRVLITGTIFTARDAAHIRMLHDFAEGKDAPFDLKDSIIYYAGPSPTRPGNVSGSFGPTTAGRMDDMTIPLLERGVRGMIAKGDRRADVIDAIVKYKAIYFAAIGGAGALIAASVKKIEVIAYDDLGAEAIRRIQVVDFPAIVAIDTYGTNIFDHKELI